VLLPKHAIRNPSGITCGYATLDLLLRALAKGALLFFVQQKKEVPLFTKKYFQHLLNN
jgi:hypothetical protein